MPDKTISLRVSNCMPEIYGRQRDCLFPTSSASTKPNNRTARCSYYLHVNTFHGGETSPTSFHFTSNSNFRLRADKPQNVRSPEDVRVDSATNALTIRFDAYRLNETNSPTRAIESDNTLPFEMRYGKKSRSDLSVLSSRNRFKSKYKVYMSEKLQG